MIEHEGIQYDAILVRGTPRYRANRRMVAADSIPAEVKAALIKQIQQPKEIQPSPAEIQQTANVLTEAGIAPYEDEFLPSPAPLEGADFSDNTQPAVVPATANGMPSEYEMELIQQVEDMKKKLAEDEANKTLPELAKEMYQRFGIYTVFVGAPPKDGDAHPFNGQPMTRYELGLAYQQFNRTQAQGLLNVDYERQHAQQQQSEIAREVHANEMAARGDGYNGGYSSFAERTSVKAQNQPSTHIVTRQNDPISEDVTAEPNLRGQTVRPQW